MKSLCTPEKVIEVSYPGALHPELANKSLVYELENNSRAVIHMHDGKTLDDDGFAIIKGMEDSANHKIALIGISQS